MRAILPVLLAVLLATAACAGRPAEPPTPAPTTARLVITASPVLNPNEAGEAEPVIVRLFRLRSADGFRRAAFADLAEPLDEKTLGQDLVGTVEFEFYPGQSETLTREFDPGDRWLGIVAEYREHGTAKWRDLIELVPNAETEVDLQLGPRAVLARVRPS
ncbi:MAG: type VI secretion system lipoprotein TssJ [Alphaproteobacteria bacterium]